MSERRACRGVGPCRATQQDRLTPATDADALRDRIMAKVWRSRCGADSRPRDVQEVFSALCLRRGGPTHIRSDNGPELIARAWQGWSRRLTVAPFCIEPGSAWENGSGESCNGKVRDELVNGEVF